MAHASKRISTIPTEAIVQIFAWEGLLYKAQKDLADILKSILDGDDSPALWVGLDKHRKQAVFYSQQYTKAILRLQISQEKG